jgi:hypothetical protein
VLHADLASADAHTGCFRTYLYRNICRDRSNCVGPTCVCV